MDNRSVEVDEWFESYDNQQRQLVLAVRAVILDVDGRMSRRSSGRRRPSCTAGTSRPSTTRSARHLALMFHTRASLPDPSGLLEGDGDTSRVARFTDAEDLAAKADALCDLVRAWISLKE